MYFAVELLKSDQQMLKGFADTLFLPGWEKQCHHVTIHMGPPSLEEQSYIDKGCLITIDGIAKTEKVVALRVQAVHRCDTLPMSRIVFPDGKQPHITLLVNRDEGGKPKDANTITEWEPLIPELGTFKEGELILRGLVKTLE